MQREAVEITLVGQSGYNVDRCWESAMASLGYSLVDNGRRGQRDISAVGRGFTLLLQLLSIYLTPCSWHLW